MKTSVLPIITCVDLILTVITPLVLIPALATMDLRIMAQIATVCEQLKF